jgi:hypothetical protein
MGKPSHITITKAWVTMTLLDKHRTIKVNGHVGSAQIAQIGISINYQTISHDSEDNMTSFIPSA